MSIVKMKRVRLIGLNTDKDALLKELMLLGCVQLTEIEQSDDIQALITPGESDLSVLRTNQLRLTQAMAILKKFAPEKSGLFPEKDVISAKALFAPEVVEPNLEAAASIVEKHDEINRLYGRISQLESGRATMDLWKNLDVPLDTSGTQRAAVIFGTVPIKTDQDALTQDLYAKVEYAQVYSVGSSREGHCLMVICLRERLDEALALLRELGFSQTVFSEKGTAGENLARINRDLEGTRERIKTLSEEIAAFGNKWMDFKLCEDRLTQEIQRAEAEEKLCETGYAFAMEGWLSAPEEDALGTVLSQYAAAWELSDPEPEEYPQVPVKLKNNCLTEPMNMVTEMYSLPAYDGIDPNGLIMPFFVVFFGIMYADLGYGILLTLIGLYLGRKRIAPGLKRAMHLLVQVGISTAAFGAFFGGFFGDAIPVFTETYLGTRMGVWGFDPLNNPMILMMGSLVLGGIQIIVGMAAKAYISIRDGHPLEALLDVGTWWLLFIGIAVLALGYTPWVAVVGIVSLILTQGRNSPTIPGKIIGGIASLYDITSYLSDLLSYIRLMALLLATSVIAQVMNLLASMVGGIPVIGIFLFVLIFVFGHVFNMGINIIGTFVHAARLQFLEFFGKFYKEGGKPFMPLGIKTKYFDIEK